MLKRIAAAVIIFLAMMAGTLVSPGHAVADGNIGGVKCDPTNPEPGCTVEVGTPSIPGDSNGGHSSGNGVCHGSNGVVLPCHTADGDVGSDGCYYRLATAKDGIDPAAAGPGGGAGVWYVKTCNSDPNLSSQSTVFLPTAPVVTPQVLAQQARSMLRLPRVVVSLNPAGDQLVNLPTWLSLAAGSWASQSATAAVPGLSVTATATPVSAVFQMGDGSTVTCTGPGTSWQPGGDPAAASPDCGHRYTRSSAGQPGSAFAVTVTVTWNVAWAGGGAAGVVAGLTTVGVVAVRVAESQAVLT